MWWGPKGPDRAGSGHGATCYSKTSFSLEWFGAQAKAVQDWFQENTTGSTFCSISFCPACLIFLGFGVGRWHQLRKESHKREKGRRPGRRAVQPECLAVFGHEERGPLKITGEQSSQSGPISVLEASSVEQLASLKLRREGRLACLPADRTLIFVFHVYCSWTEEIRMAEGKGTGLLFGLTVVWDLAGRF